MTRHWTLDDIGWDAFDPARVDAETVRVVKAAALVEANSADYVTYLHRVFHDDPPLCDLIARWGVEEELHGLALARWATLADPAWNFEAALARFRAGYSLPLDAAASVRGSRAGELLARCVVECGTSSFYSAIRDASDEPVLKAVCHRIAGDEFRHYKLFYDGLRAYGARDGLSLLTRARVAFGRVAEADDDELSFAFFCGNHAEEGAAGYDRKRCAAAYELRASRLYRYGHVARALSMMVKAMGLDPHGRLATWMTRGAWWAMQRRQARFARMLGPVQASTHNGLAEAA